jgi:hypothetical protein
VTPANILAAVLGAAVAVLGVVGIATPSALLELGQSLQTQGALYVAAAVRIMFGVVLICAAPASRMPGTLRFIGALVIVAGLLSPLVGVERALAMLEWFSSHGPMFMRAWASLAVVFGGFVVYAVTSPRRAAA